MFVNQIHPNNTRVARPRLGTSPPGGHMKQCYHLCENTICEHYDIELYLTWNKVSISVKSTIWQHHRVNVWNNVSISVKRTIWQRHIELKDETKLLFLWNKQFDNNYHQIDTWNKAIISVKRSISQHIIELAQQTGDVNSTLDQCWPIVCDVGPKLTGHWFSFSCLLGNSWNSRDVDIMLFYCWASIADGGPTLKQHWINHWVPILLWIPQYPITTVRHDLPCKAERQYLLTSQVNRYCLLALQSSMECTHVIHALYECTRHSNMWTQWIKVVVHTRWPFITQHIVQGHISVNVFPWELHVNSWQLCSIWRKINTEQNYIECQFFLKLWRSFPGS